MPECNESGWGSFFGAVCKRQRQSICWQSIDSYDSIHKIIPYSEESFTDRNQKIHNLYHWFQTEHETNRPLQHVETVEEVNCFWKSYGSELEQACDEYWADFSHELPTEDEGFGVSWVVLLASCFFLILFKN